MAQEFRRSPSLAARASVLCTYRDGLKENALRETERRRIIQVNTMFLAYRTVDTV